MREEPQIPNFGRKNEGPRLKDGVTLAIEPMVNLGSHEVDILTGWMDCCDTGSKTFSTLRAHHTCDAYRTRNFNYLQKLALQSARNPYLPPSFFQI